MSAYVVDRRHVQYLVAAAMSRRMNPLGAGAFSYWHDGERREFQDRAADRSRLGLMLWRECVRSVSYRYEGPEEELPGPTQDGPRFGYIDRHDPCLTVEPVQVLKAVDCYEYQSCEDPEWEASEAKAFCERLRHAAIAALPGYEEAAWGAPEPPAARRRVTA